jgi:hypothetical protein
MQSRKKFFAEVQLNGYSLADIKPGYVLRDRHLLKDFLEYIHLKKGLLEAYDAEYPLVEPRELLPSFEKNFSEYHHLPCFSMVAFNRPLAYQEEIFQFDLLHPLEDGKRRSGRENLEKILPHLDRERHAVFKTRFAPRDLPKATFASWGCMPPSRPSSISSSSPLAASSASSRVRTAPPMN